MYDSKIKLGELDSEGKTSSKVKSWPPINALQGWVTGKKIYKRIEIQEEKPRKDKCESHRSNYMTIIDQKILFPIS